MKSKQRKWWNYYNMKVIFRLATLYNSRCGMSRKTVAYHLMLALFVRWTQESGS
ncbi:MAG: hypothetical protein LBG80_10750 [Bacteroidales bacterium]|nr:hypothetical protein [Bacteroidales bacterium]